MLGRLWNLLPSETLHGYEHPELIETIFRKTLAYEPTDPWPEMEGVSSVLDFGGACGRHYKEARRHSLAIRWAIVETPAMVRRAMELETHQLRFFTDVESAVNWLGAVDVIHSNGALQYTVNPIKSVSELCYVGAQRIMWRRLLLGSGNRETQVSRLTDNGPGSLRVSQKKVAYEQTSVNELDFIATHAGYELIARGPDWFDFAR